MTTLTRRIERLERRQDSTGQPGVYVVAAPYSMSETEILRSIGAPEDAPAILLHLWEEPTPRLIG